MIELVFIACLKAQPDACEERRLSYATEVNLTICSMNAQSYLAAWAGEHPSFTVGAWRCEDPRRRPSRA